MRPIGRKPRGGGGIYVLVVVVAAVLAWMFQDRWMARKRQEARSEQGVVMTPNGFADKAAHWMLRRRGLEKEEAGGGGMGTGSGAGEMGPKTITCWACEGTGKAYDDGGKAVPCGVCQGVGERVVRPFDGEDRICSACSGMGRVEEEGGGAKECPACGGRGYVRGAE